MLRIEYLFEYSHETCQQIHFWNDHHNWSLPVQLTHLKAFKTFVKHKRDPTLEELLLKITDRYFDLTETAAGALCVVEILGVIPSDFFQIILDNYANIKDGHTAFKHMIGDHSQLVFQSCLSLFGPETLRPWISSLSSFVAPHSMTLLSGNWNNYKQLSKG